jgi:hypothetical protein
MCVEYNKKRMTRQEMLRALPEMIMFAKNEEERAHFERLKKLEGTDLEYEVESHVQLNIKKK